MIFAIYDNSLAFKKILFFYVKVSFIKYFIYDESGCALFSKHNKKLKFISF